MRKITREVVGAFLQRQPLSKSNTVSTGDNLYLHGNLIAYHVRGGIMISTCGWDTVTTRERLNAIPHVMLSHRKGVLYMISGKGKKLEWNGEAMFIPHN